MASRYLVGSSLSLTSAWSTSSGGASGASVPTVADDVFVDANSPSFSLGATKSWKSVNFTGFTNSATFDALLAVAGNVTLSAGMMIVDSGGLVNITATSTLTANGKIFNASLSFGASATFTLVDQWSVTSLVLGNYNTILNGFKIRVSGNFTVNTLTTAPSGTTEIELYGSGTVASSLTTGSVRCPVIFASTASYSLTGNLSIGGTLTKHATAALVTDGSTLTLTGAAATVDTSTVVWNDVTINGTLTHTFTTNLYCGGTLTLGATTGTTTINGSEIVHTGTVVTSLITTGRVTGTAVLRLQQTCTLGSSAFTTGSIVIPHIIDAPGKTITISSTWQTDVCKWQILAGKVVNANGQTWVDTQLIYQRTGRVVDTGLIPGSNPRLYFRAWTADTTPLPKTDLVAVGVSAAAYRRRVGNVWSDTVSISPLADGTEFQSYAVGKLIKHSCPLGNLYSIDAPVAATDAGAESVRLSLTLSSGTVDAYEHGINLVAGTLTDDRTAVNAVLDSSTLSKIDAILEDTGTTLPSQISSGASEPTLMLSTTIATLASQTSFTLAAGSADDDAYNRQLVVITNAATSSQKSRAIVADYAGLTKTVTLLSDPAFTIAVGDRISIVAIGSDVSSAQMLSAISSAVVSAGITTTVNGMPSFLRVGDARTVANGAAINVRLYNVDDDSLLFGLGENLFEDATITFSLRRAGTDVTEGVEDAAIPCTWVEDGADGYVQIAYDADALDNCDAMDRLKEKDCHRWGIKFQWGTDDPITPIYGNISVLRKIVTTQS